MQIQLIAVYNVSNATALKGACLKIESGRSLAPTFREMSGKRGSNPRPLAWEANALPTELLPRNNY